MFFLEEIREWWQRKLENYLKKYTRRNFLTLTQARAQFFIETHEKILEKILEEIKNYIE
jgi:hypothetical protein